MRVTAPVFACPLLRPFGVGGEQRLGVSVLSAWTLDGAPLPAPELWTRFIRAAGPEVILDAALPKSASEWLLLGHAYSPQPVTEIVAGVETQGGYKALSVIGDRVWRGGVPSAPEPFTKMPLDWSRAFGGEGYADNPLGRGFVSGEPEGVLLPNVELHGRLIDAPSDRPTPAGFGALGVDWPLRTRGLGTYDRRWFEREYPGFASDIDWRVHNVAPEDQRIEGELQPGQEFVLHNLIEGRSRVAFELPRVRARCFTYANADVPALVEVPLLLRTVWLVPDEDMVVLVSSGSCLSDSSLLSDVAGVFAGLDWIEAPRGLDYWAGAHATRLDTSEDGALAALDDAPLMPEGLALPGQVEEDLALPQRSGALAANLHRAALARREEALRLFAEAGLEGGEALFPPPAPPRSPAGPEQAREAFANAKRQEAKTREQLARMREDAQIELAAAGFDASALERRPPQGPPRVLASKQLELLEAAVREGRAAGLPTEGFEQRINDPDFHRSLIEKERQGREGYRLTAHREGALPEEPSLDARMALREQVERAIRDGESLSERDLTCADLNELDLSGMDLRGAWLEGAELERANLTGAKLERAVLAKATLAEATLHETDLRFANLGRARLLWTRFVKCDLEQAILSHANLRAASFIDCDLHGADLSEARFEQTVFDGSDLTGVMLMKMSLGGVEFRTCRLVDATLLEVELDEASFHRCDLTKATLVTCHGSKVRFDEAVMENARFVAGCVFDGADFRGADLSQATLRGGSFIEAHFDEACLRSADLSQAQCDRASFVRADLRSALATECQLAGAVLRGANLMDAVLQGSDLRGADLSHTNLHGADLSLVRGNERTTLEGALSTRMRIRPLRGTEPMRADKELPS